MSKRDTAAPVLVEDFEPFYMRAGLLYVPYRSDGRAYIHKLTPETTFRGIGYALRVLGDGGNIVPFALRALKERRDAGGRA